ncbi:MAG: hypothetical protein PHP57_12265 [Sideroxydans sp.]|nr:hypothetical protein [Sideroxydans sp.]
MSEHVIFERLRELGAGEFEHLNGTLLSHLIGTHDLLHRWGANEVLCKAGLYHAVYGTDGYDGKLLALNERLQIQELVGSASEEVIYMYCACDRNFFWPQFGVVENPVFRNRFSSEEYVLENDALKNFCELTAANELEIAGGSTQFISKYGTGLRSLFMRMKPYLSNPAYDFFVETLGEANA